MMKPKEPRQGDVRKGKRNEDQQQPLRALREKNADEGREGDERG